MERITKKCYLCLLNEISNIKSKLLPEIRRRIQDARKNGDYSENSELQYELKCKRDVEKKLELIENTISNSVVVDILDIEDKSAVQFGSSVEVTSKTDNSKTVYHIGGLYESDINTNHIYYKSPLAKSLISRRLGEQVKIIDTEYTITNISYDNISA